MKNKAIKFLAFLLILATLVAQCFVLVSCKKPSIQGSGYTEAIDESRTQLYVYNYDGGYGSEWMNKVKLRYEALHAEDVYEPGTGKKGIQIMVNNSKTAISSSSILGNPEEVYFTENVYYYTLRYDNALADITAAVTGTNPYEPKKTVESKFSDQQKEFYNTAENGAAASYLGIPHYAGSYGIVYDMDLFEQKGYFFLDGYDPTSPVEEQFIYEDGDKKTAGPDGVYGTSDDGLPATYDEFFTLCEYIYSNGQIPISWSGLYYTQYVGFLMHSLVADFEGFDNMMLNYSLNGTADDLGTIVNGVFVKDSTPTVITEQNAYEVRRQEGVYRALEFINKLLNTNKYHNDTAFSNSHSQLDNQADFLQSCKDGKPIAMSIDGVWWQSEASQIFDNMVSRYGNEYSQQNRKLGWMPLPKATADKVGEKSTTVDSMYSLCFVKKNIADWKLPIAVDFLQFVNTDESLTEFTMTTNTVKALNYTLTPDQQAKLSPYGKTIYENAQNSAVVYPYSKSAMYTKQQSAFRGDDFYHAKIGSSTKNYPALAFHVDGISAADYFKGIYEYYKNILK